jgi:hypothetical protein
MNLRGYLEKKCCMAQRTDDVASSRKNCIKNAVAENGRITNFI